MKSQTRQSCEDSVTLFSKEINKNLQQGNLLYVGIAGDPIGGEYSYLFKNFDIKTFDIGECWKPDIVGDITKTEFSDESWDVVICVQTMEHIPNLLDLPKELYRIIRSGGYAIVDCPFNYPYHAEPPNFGDYWRITKDGMNVLFGPYFSIEKIDDQDYNTSCLLRKV